MILIAGLLLVGISQSNAQQGWGKNQDDVYEDRRGDNRGYDRNNGNWNNDNRNNGNWNNGNGYGRGQGRSNIDDRQYVQQHRIYRGMRDGSLRPWEAQRLQRELDRIERMEWAFRRNDGRLDYRERQILDRELDRLSYNTYADRRNWNNRY